MNKRPISLAYKEYVKVKEIQLKKGLKTHTKVIEFLVNFYEKTIKNS